MNELAVVQPQRQSLTGFTPRDAKGLAWLANEVVKSGMFMVGRRTMTGSEAFVVMMKGAELGLTPMQSLAEISIIKGRPFVSKDVLTARITRSPRCVAWDPSDCDPKHCTISFQVAGSDPTSLTTLIDDIPERYFKPSSSGEPSNWTLVPEDMLFAWTVRRIARRFFPEALLDIGESHPDYDETRVINVAAVEREVGRSEFGSHAGCGGAWLLQSNTRTGGAFLRCDQCSATTGPPDDVRDAVRGVPEALTLAGPALEAGEREPEPGEIEEVSDATEVAGVATAEGAAGVAEPPAVDGDEDGDVLQVDREVAPPLTAFDAEFAEAAGIAESAVEAQKPAAPVMTRTDVDLAVQAILGALVAAKKAGREELTLAQSIVRRAGYSEGPLSAWLENHVEELPGLVAAL